MPHILGFDTLLAILLEEREEISFTLTRQIIEKCSRDINNLIISNHVNSVSLAIQWYPNVFKMDLVKKTFRRADNSEEYFVSNFIKDEFFSEIPEDILLAIKSVYNSIMDNQ